MALQLQPFKVSHLDFAKTPRLVFPASELRLKVCYALEQVHHSNNPAVQERNEQLPELTERMVEYRGEIVLRTANKVMAHDAYSHQQEMMVWVRLYRDAAADAAELRREIIELGGVPFPEPLGFTVPFMPDGI